ncbi:VanZ family protein [Rossellomorea marisflavi]|jgi:glycopeptide antibiotics resistance protein|uniref:VanZ family protein n=1 Tax=Rossellomorea marisflavi TaxID=189381 RepID=UPI002867C8B1|nr:VanZ family protein [Rossellomorea marisflavi]
MMELWRSFGWSVPILLTAATALIMIIITNQGRSRKRDLLPKVFTILSIGAVCLLTLTPLDGPNISEGQTNFEPFSNLKLNLHGPHIEVPIRNLLANVLLFVPFGFFVAWWMKRKKALGWKVTGAGALLSLIIEGCQYVFPLGRATDIDDWMMNTLGALVGVILFQVGQSLYRIIKNNWRRGRP